MIGYGHHSHTLNNSQTKKLITGTQIHLGASSLFGNILHLDLAPSLVPAASPWLSPRNYPSSSPLQVAQKEI